MAGKLEFREKLGGILTLAEQQGGSITLEEAEQYFEEDNLSAEQMDLVCDYLLSQKVAVRGYEKKGGKVTDNSREPVQLSPEEQAFLEEYMRELSSASVEDARMNQYLPKVVELAKQMHEGDIFLGDMIQEGNVSLMLALKECGGQADEEARVTEAVRAGIQAMREAQAETRRRDKKMVEQVAELDEKIKNLTEELGRKVSVDEVAEYMDMTEEQIINVLKLAGEEAEEESE